MSTSSRPTTPINTPACTPTPIQPTSNAISASMSFALLPVRSDLNPFDAPIDDGLRSQIESSPLTLITGPSGSGKSSLIRALSSSAGDVLTCDQLPEEDPDLPMTDLFRDWPLEKVLRLLCGTGLAQPNLWALPARALSAGQLERLNLARLVYASHQMMGRTGRSPTIVIDEFCSTLDRLCARALSSVIRRLVHGHGLRMVVAGAHEDLVFALDADLLIDASTRSVVESRYRPETIGIELGTRDDYRSLSHHHYIAGAPANPCLYLRATRPHPVTGDPTLAAVLVVTYPTLNGIWRGRAWPGRYTKTNGHTDATRLNKEVRTLSRVIVDPRARSLGLATKLVKHYLSNPLTPCTEARAAMGGFSSFFGRAGMVEYPIPHTPSDTRLLDALTHEQMSPHDLIRYDTIPPLVNRELKMWARQRKIDPDADNLAHHAAFRLLSQPRAYTHTVFERNQL